MSDVAPNLSPAWRVRAALGLILLLAVFLRWHTIMDRGFFFDELWIVELSSGHGSDFLTLPVDTFIEQPNLVALPFAKPAWQVPANTTGAIHPPGTFVVLRLWREIFGDSMLALRSCSAAWSTLVVLLCYFAGKRSFGAAAGLWAALMSAISLGNIDQAQDIRGYTMLQAELLLTALALLNLRDAHDHSPWRWLGPPAIGFGVLAMMFTHYFAAGVCLAITAGVLTLLRGRARWGSLGAIGVAGVIWVVAWLPHLRAQLAFVPETADTFLLDRAASPVAATFQRLIAAPYQALIGDPRTTEPLLFFAGLILFILLALRVQRADRGSRVVVCFWLSTILFTLGLLLTMDLLRQTKILEFMKYFLVITPALCVLLGSLVMRKQWLMPAAVCLALATMHYLTPIPGKADIRPQLAWLKDRLRPTDTVILPSFNQLGRDGQVTYLSLAHAVPFARHRIVIPVGQASPSLVNQLPRDGRWFCFAFAGTWQPLQHLPGVKIVETGPADSAAVYELAPVALPDHLPN